MRSSWTCSPWVACSKRMGPYGTGTSARRSSRTGPAGDGSAPRFLLDPYALVEVTKGNPRYRRFLAAKLFTTLWNLAELYLVVLRDRGEKEARNQFARFRDLAGETPDDWLFEAMGLKLRKPSISYAVFCLQQKRRESS